GEYFREPFHGARFFNLGHQPRSGPFPVQVMPGKQDVVTAADEAHGDPVDTELHAGDEVFDVFFGQRRDAQVSVGNVDALVVGKDTADDDFRLDRLSLYTRHFQPQSAVVQQEGIARFHVGVQSPVGDADAGDVTRA